MPSATVKTPNSWVRRSRPFAWKASWVRASPFRDMRAAKDAEAGWKRGGQSVIGFTATSSLKAMGRIVRASGKYEVGTKYRSIQ